jgi:hypothetical protein
MTKWAELFNASRTPIVLEDCDNGLVTPSNPTNGPPQPGWQANPVRVNTPGQRAGSQLT